MRCLRSLFVSLLAFVTFLLGPFDTVYGRSQDFFRIQVLDRQTGRGVPLVELRTVNNIRYHTDSNGVIAFSEPGLMGTEVFFFVSSHGYQFPKDGFGMRGTRLKAVAGDAATIKIDRINIAERLYRVTGGGIYRDSVLTGHPVPIEEPLLNSRVFGQDSVYTCIYRGRLFWLWGDTAKPSYPLGHFGAAGAFSSLPDSGGLDPDLGVNLEYFIDQTGFSRPMCRMKDPGMYWLDGLLKAKDPSGNIRMIAMCSRMKSLGEAHERGMVIYNDETESFQWLHRSGPDFLPYRSTGHTFRLEVDGQFYHYFATQFPLTVRMRVKDNWKSVTDVNQYEVYTAIGNKNKYRWIKTGQLLKRQGTTISTLIEQLQKEKDPVRLTDIESGKKIYPHGGSINYNTYRNKWIMITVEHFGDSSMLGEVWYAEADSPMGPWKYAMKIATHNKYSFYNPVHHPYFDKEDGRIIYFEGTYTHTFSGTPENATPRYDYNQIMYKLYLSDERLSLTKQE